MRKICCGLKLEDADAIVDAMKRGDFYASSGVFLEDIGSEQPQSIRHSLLRTRRGEPLTIAAEG